MVIGERFAWAHLPKTAGDATHAMLVAVSGLAVFADPPDSNDKHLPFFAREAEIAGRLRVMNIRRLPAWALSGAHHRAAYGVHPDYRPGPLETPDQMASRTDADDLLRWMTDHGRLAVERWLRAERLQDDVLALLGELGVLTAEVGERVLAVGRVNVGSYDRDLSRWFTPEQIHRLYARNPEWARVERLVYGALLDLPAPASRRSVDRPPSPTSRSGRDRGVLAREATSRRRTSSRSRSAGSACPGPSPSDGGTARRRAGRRPARRSAGRSAAPPAACSTLRLRDRVVEHRLLGGGGDVALEPAGDDVEPRGLVPAARERQPQVERAHRAHEETILVPGAGNRRVGLAQRRLVDRDQRRLAEIAAHELGQPRAANSSIIRKWSFGASAASSPPPCSIQQRTTGSPEPGRGSNSS